MVPSSPPTRRAVLVVDDDADARSLLSDYLQSQGFEVDQASDGIDAISYLYATKPAAVLIDVLMPRMNGVDVIRQIRSDRKLAGVSVIAMSAATEMLARATEAGAEAVVRKPLDLRVVLRAVRTHVGPARGPAASRKEDGRDAGAAGRERRRRRVA